MKVEFDVKFKRSDEVYVIIGNKICKCEVVNATGNFYVAHGLTTHFTYLVKFYDDPKQFKHVDEKVVFATKDEAEASMNG